MPRLDRRGTTCAYLPMRLRMSGSRFPAIATATLWRSMPMCSPLAVVDARTLMTDYPLETNFVNANDVHVLMFNRCNHWSI